MNDKQSDTAEKRATMRSQVEQIAETVLQLKDDAEKAKARTGAQVSPRPVAEAATLADCMRALDSLAEADRGGRSGGLSWPMAGASTSIERVLRHLAAKYDVPLIERVQQPCARRHVDVTAVYVVGGLLATFPISVFIGRFLAYGDQPSTSAADLTNAGGRQVEQRSKSTTTSK